MHLVPQYLDIQYLKFAFHVAVNQHTQMLSNVWCEDDYHFCVTTAAHTEVQ